MEELYIADARYLSTAMKPLCATCLHKKQQVFSLKKTDLLINDKISTGHKHVFESIDRTMQDILKNSSPFGGPTVLLAGDWRQILPSIRHGSRPDIVETALKSSYLWQTVTRLQLTQNMRAKLRVGCPNQAVNGISLINSLNRRSLNPCILKAREHSKMKLR